MRFHPFRILLLACLGAGAAAAQAHDTWFRALSMEAGTPVLALGTGNRFPVQESGVGAEYLERQGCSRKTARDGEGSATSQLLMNPLRNDAHALILRGVAQARSCWAQLVPLDIELPADKVALYLREVQADAALRAVWADMQRRGVPWKERYTKHARIDFGTLGMSAGEPTPMAMDIVREAPGNGHLNGHLGFRVLRDGQPLPGLAVEWVSASASIGIWRRTDADGRVSVPALPPGRWVLRATDLRLSTTEPDHWESRFVTLAFEVPSPSVDSAAAAAATPPPR